MQEIIVYRNPVEAAFWNGASDYGFLIIAWMVLTVACIWAVSFLHDKFVPYRYRRRTDRYYGVVMVTCGVATGAVVGYLL